MAPFKNTEKNPFNNKNKNKKTHIQFLKMIKISKSHFKIQFKIFILFICSPLSEQFFVSRSCDFLSIFQHQNLFYIQFKISLQFNRHQTTLMTFSLSLSSTTHLCIPTFSRSFQIKQSHSTPLKSIHLKSMIQCQLTHSRQTSLSSYCRRFK